jgi:hypothetical protein
MDWTLEILECHISKVSMENQFNSHPRLEYIDQLKGLAILCIVLLHYEAGIFPDKLNTCIGLFMITAFYFTSGWIQGLSSKPRSVKDLIRKRLHSLGVPYVWFVSLILLFDLIWSLCGFAEWKLLATHLYNAVILRGIGTLWFLPALFGGEIIFTWLRNRNNLLLTLFIFAATIIYLYYFNCWHYSYRELSDLNRIIDAPFHAFSRMISAWPVIGMGFLLSKFYHQQVLETSAAVKFVCGVGLLVSICASICWGIGTYDSFVVNTLLPFGWMLIFMSLPKNPVSRFFSFWGRNSLILMATHYSILMEICLVINRDCLGHAEFEGLNTLLFFVVTILVEYPIVWFFNHKCQFMLGK